MSQTSDGVSIRRVRCDNCNGIRYILHLHQCHTVLPPLVSGAHTLIYTRGTPAQLPKYFLTLTSSINYFSLLTYTYYIVCAHYTYEI